MRRHLERILGRKALTGYGASNTTRRHCPFEFCDFSVGCVKACS